MKLEITLTDEQSAQMKAALLNSMEPEAIPADKEPKPEPAKRREWTLHRQELNDFARIVDASPFPHSKRIRVREVLPGDPSPEQVEAMIDALRCAKANKPGWMITVSAALQPFTGKESK